MCISQTPVRPSPISLFYNPFMVVENSLFAV